jgi:hypothetical protein
MNKKMEQTAARHKSRALHHHREYVEHSILADHHKKQAEHFQQKAQHHWDKAHASAYGTKEYEQHFREARAHEHVAGYHYNHSNDASNKASNHNILYKHYRKAHATLMRSAKKLK